MGADDGMADARGLSRICRHLDAPAQLPGAVMAGVVLDRPPRGPIAQRRRQLLAGEIHIGETGIAALLGDFQGEKQARARRLGAIGHVGVPGRLVGAERADGLAVLDDVRYDGDFRMLRDRRHASGVDRRRVELPEPAAEPAQITGQILVAENDDEVAVPHRPDRLEGLPVDGADIQPADLRAQSGARRDDFDAVSQRFRHADLARPP